LIELVQRKQRAGGDEPDFPVEVTTGKAEEPTVDRVSKGLDSA
jgi:hypothetical protein